ncbi:heme-binding domain-containing protein [Acidicapsa acidisoli]|uniref:heme-binding domain-containing protein n=1 Tax=Acidicapsa acidisoli TaxID=1615681 RepID=UPI0021E02CAB|nr:heme-binding domain-containing protein [Acidicapsa acidisoli]
MRTWTIAALALAAIVGLGYIHPFGNPRVEPARGLDTLLLSANMPANTKAVLVAKCADCHSNETRWPVYARIAPGSWLIERDIVKAREEMNLSRWDQIPPEKQEVLKAKIVQEAKSGDMPPVQYLALHWTAKLSSRDVQALAMLSQHAVGGEAALTGLGDPMRGQAVFEKRCTGCHAIEVNREGPRLAGVFGRQAGSVAGFTYSAKLKKSGITWDDATLDKWLSDPDLMVPDNDMSINVPKAADRQDLIAFLKQKQ